MKAQHFEQLPIHEFFKGEAQLIYTKRRGKHAIAKNGISAGQVIKRNLIKVS